MDRRELNAARRIIAGLVRSKTVRKRTKDKPPESTEPAPRDRPAGYRQTVHIGLDAADLADIEKIIARMKRHPTIGRLHNNIGRVKAILFAITECAKAAD
jgi:hypothetical protein